MANTDLLKIFAITAATALALSLLMLAGTKRAEAAFPGSAGDIAFHTTRDGNFQVYRMGADGFSPTRLSDTAERNLLPAWSADGRKVAFVNIDAQNNSDIYVMDHDGQNEDPLTEDPAFESAPAWFPSNNKIAFQRNDGSGSDIYSMTFDGSRTVTGTLRLTRHAAGDGEPAVSPDGKKIAFSSSRGGSVSSEIYVMKANTPEGPTNRPIRLTNNAASDSKPEWSPDGKKIVFQSRRTGDEEVFVMNADGSRQRNLTKNPAEDGDPVFSPDGKRIAFYSARPMGPVQGDAEIWRMRADGTNPVQLTENENITDAAPVWQPIP